MFKRTRKLLKKSAEVWKKYKPMVEISGPDPSKHQFTDLPKSSGRPAFLPKPKKGEKAYDPSLVDKYVQRLPIIGDKRFGQKTEWKQEEYPTKIRELSPHEVLSLRRLSLNVPNWEVQKKGLEEKGINFQQVKIAQGRMFTFGGKSKLVEASQILEKNIKDKKKHWLRAITGKNERLASCTFYIAKWGQIMRRHYTILFCQTPP